MYKYISKRSWLRLMIGWILVLWVIMAQGQCWQRVLTHECFTENICDFQVQINPNVDYKIQDGSLWIEADKCTNYNIIVGSTACDGDCDQGQFEPISYDSNCCTFELLEDEYECGGFQPYKKYQRIFNCECDTTLITTINPSPVYNLTDTMYFCEYAPNPYKEYHTTNHGCDSIVEIIPILIKPSTLILEPMYGFSADTIITLYADIHGCDSFTLQIILETSMSNGLSVHPPREISTNDDGEVTIQVSETPEDTITKNVTIYIANAFSPNGDGINDVFELQTDDPIHIDEWMIYDRWGGLVFEGMNISNKTAFWNGGDHQNGVFIYRVKIGNDIITGEISIHR